MQPRPVLFWRRRQPNHVHVPLRPAIEAVERRLLLSAVDVLTQHNDVSRTGANLGETVLNTTNVNQNTFGRLYARPVDDQIYAQPLVATSVNIPGKGTHNVLYVATVNDSVYAFDADDATAPALWQDSFVNPAQSIRPVINTEVGQACGTYLDFSGNIGIVGTPAIDKASNTMYVLARTVENGTFVQRLHALDLSTGAEKMGGPTVITASVPGTGAGSVNGNLAFNPQTENQRAGLLLSGGNVVIAWASHCDTGPYHGWVMAYNASNIAQQKWVFNTAPNGSNAGIWQSGEGIAADAAGNLYFTTGNGTTSPAQGNYGEAFLKLSPAGQVLDYFIPSNWSNLNNVDADLGSAGTLLIPGTSLMVGGGKEGKLYLVDRNNLGKLNTTDQVVQEFQLTPHANSDHIHGSPIYWQDGSGNQWIYVWGMNDKLKQFQFANGMFASTTPTHTSNVTLAPTPSQPGGLLSLSANGGAAGSGIVWSMSTLGPSANNAVQPGIVRAFDAADVSHELWNSQQNAARDDFGNLAKFNYPTIDNGRVYVPTFSNQLVVYGLLTGLPATPASLTATPVAGKTEIDLSWASVSGAVQYSIERRSGSSGNFVPLAIVPAGTTTYADASAVGGTMYTYRVRARNATGESSPVSATATSTLIQQQLARWKFDEGTGGTAADASGNGNTGTLGSSTTWTTGKVGTAALNFDGTGNAYVQVPDSPSLNPGSQITIAAWINCNSWSAGNPRVLQKGASDNQYRLTAENGVFKFDLKNVGTITAALPSTGVWHHVAGTYDGSTMRLYVDGAVVATGASTGPLATTADPLFIGTKSAGGVAGNHFNGKIDDVRIYNYALPGADLATLATGTAPSAPSGLVVTPTSPSTTNVQWNDNSNNESAFELQRKTGANGTYATVATLPASSGTQVTYNDTGLTGGTTYYYRVRAVNVIDPSFYTAEQATTTPVDAINSLVARWTFDEPSGSTAADATGLGNTGTLVGGPGHAADAADGSPRSLSLDGSSQWVVVPDSFYLKPASTITLAAWVKADDWTGTRGIIAKGAREGSYYLAADQGRLAFNLSGQGTLTAPLPSTGVWHHVAGTYDGTAMRVYVDGVRVASQAATGPLATSTDNLFVGATAASTLTGVAFDGQIDDARVYNFAITPGDVSALYGNAAAWAFGEGKGATANDASPNANTLALAGAPAWTLGHGGAGLAFDGSTQYAAAVNNQVLSPTSAISLTAWVLAADWNGSPRLIQKGDADNQYRLLAENGQLKFDLAGLGSVAAPLPTTGAWHYIAGTYDGATMRLYVDGAPAGSLAATGPVATTTDSLYVGAKGPSGAAGTFFHGVLDDVGVYSRALTAGEVQAAAAVPVGITASPGAAYAFAGQTLALTGGTLTFNRDAAADNLAVVAQGPGSHVEFASSQHLSGLTLSGGATATLAGVGAGRTAANHRTLVVNALSVDTASGSRLDLADNDLVLKGGGAAGLASIQSLVSAGYNKHNWNGSGIVASAAAGKTNNALGYALNDGSVIKAKTTFGPANEAVGGTDVLVKYTWDGDANLDGQLSFDDYFYIDSKYPKNSGSTWVTGDFDYNAQTSFDDYFYIDSNYPRSNPL